MRYIILSFSTILFNLVAAQSTGLNIEIIPPPAIEVDCQVPLDNLKATGIPLLTNNMLAGPISYVDKVLKSTECGISKILRTFSATTVNNTIIEAAQSIVLKPTLEGISFPEDFCTNNKRNIEEMSPDNLAASCSISAPMSDCDLALIDHSDRIVRLGHDDYRIYRTWSAYMPCRNQQIRLHTQILQAKINSSDFDEFSSVIRIHEDASFALYQNRPNPASNLMIIGFLLPEDSQVKFFISNELGQPLLIRSGGFMKGTNEIEINLSDLPAGVYTYSLVAGTHFASKRMVLAR